jgi:hypothetical protein
VRRLSERLRESKRCSGCIAAQSRKAPLGKETVFARTIARVASAALYPF